MMQWTALVPMKLGPERKSRLAKVLRQSDREDLSDRMALHVLNQLQNCTSVSRLVVLSPVRPGFWEGEWYKDEGRGLNVEISEWRRIFGCAPMLVLHADLALVSAADIDELLRIAKISGIALASDRSGKGTNAQAIADGRKFEFLFGPNSCELHCKQAPEMPVIVREGLALDIDTPEDLDILETYGR